MSFFDFSLSYPMWIGFVGNCDAILAVRHRSYLRFSDRIIHTNTSSCTHIGDRERGESEMQLVSIDPRLANGSQTFFSSRSLIVATRQRAIFIYLFLGCLFVCAADQRSCGSRCRDESNAECDAIGFRQSLILLLLSDDKESVSEARLFSFSRFACYAADRPINGGR